MIEIERKFLVTQDTFKELAHSNTRIVQGFLNTNPERTVRIRIKGNSAFLTIKGISNESGLSRFEWEREITIEEAESLLALCEPGVIDKVRFEVEIGDYLYEVDVFKGANEGLVVAEIELKSEDEFFEKPNWIGEEVTGDIKYYNSQLSKKPYTTWAFD